MKFRKKPVVIEAERWFQVEPRFEGSERMVERYRRPNLDGQRLCEHCSIVMDSHGWIGTLEGGHIVCPGDWIITGVENERYPCRPSIFEKTYEAVE